MSDSDPSSADPFGLIADEFAEAIRQGKRPSVEEFAQRYPAHADQIREMLPALALMEEAKSADDSSGEGGPAAAPPLRQLGDYRILREVGRGGMGVVYEAQQLSLGRHVAIKVLPSHALLDPRQLQRFRREARSAARLHHTNIVPVFGVGEENGLHYYVMQFIPGLGLDLVLHELQRLRRPRGRSAPTRDEAPGQPTDATRSASAVAMAHGLLSGEFDRPRLPGECTAAPSPVAAALENPPSSSTVRAADTSASIHLPGQADGSTLTESGRAYWQSVARVGVQVADALAHAAGQGILHRDIKPSNLLLDDTGNVWVTDFGLAKADDGDNLTHTGDIVGTLRYLAPERFNGQGDLRSDVYSLGLTLYELLTLRPAFDHADRNKLVKQVMHDEPVRPRKLNAVVPRDLETVVLKAIARDPAHRYQSPADMADDLKRFLEDRPVRARRASEGEKFLRWCRRNPLPASLLAAIMVVFLAGFAGVFTQWRVAETARDDATRREREAVAARDEAKQTRNASARQAAGLLLDRGIEDARSGEPARALHLFVQALRALPADDPDAAPLERAIRANMAAWAETVPALEHIWPGGPQDRDMAFTPDGERIALAVGPDEVQCFRTDTGRPVGPPGKIPDGVGEAMVFASDGQSLWVASGGTANAGGKWGIYRLDPASGRPVQPPIATDGPFSHENVPSLEATPDGRYLVGAVLGLHPDDRGPRADANAGRLWRTASIVVWEAASGRVVRKVEVNADRSAGLHSFMGLSPDGRSVTAWFPRGTDYAGLTFAVDGNEAPLTLGRHPSRAIPPVATAFEVDNWTLHFQNHLRTALVLKDGLVHRWSVTDPRTLGPGVPVPFRAMHDRPSPDGRSVISPAESRVFDTGAWPPRPSGVRFTHPGWQRSTDTSLAQSADGRLVATGFWKSGMGDRRLWRLPRPHSRPALRPGEFARLPERPDYSHAQFDPRGTGAILWWLQGENAGHNVRLVDSATGAVRGTSVRHAHIIREAAFTPDGRHFATGSFDATARVWEAATGRPAGPPLAHLNYVATVAFSPDGNTLAAGDYGPAGLVKFWDWRTGKEVRPPLRHDDIILHVSWSPDGRYLAALKLGDWSKHPELVVWEVASGSVAFRAPHNSPGYLLSPAARFRPDGRAVAARDVNGVLRLWEVPSGKPLGERPLDGDGVTRFSPDGRVVAASANLGVRLLDADTLAPLPDGFLAHPDPIQDVAFSPDGAFLLTGHETGSAQLWDVATRKPVGPPAVLLGPIRAVVFPADGKTCACVAADGTVRRWPVPVPFAEPDLDRLADRVALLTGQRMESSPGLDAVPADEWRALRARLVGEGSTALVPPRPDADWHDAVAADAEQDGDVDGAEWHLNRLARLRPHDWTIPARRGRLLATAGRRVEADAAYASARRLAPSPQVLSDWLRAAAEAEAASRKEAARWNLDRAIALTPGDWTLYALRADLSEPAQAVADEDEAIRLGAEPALVEKSADRSAELGDWKRAAALLRTVTRVPDFNSPLPYQQAIACLKAGDAAGYRAVCATAAERMATANPMGIHHQANRAARVAVLGPNATDDWARALGWIDQALSRLAEIEKARPNLKDLIQRERHRFLNTRGAVLYRAGRFEEAAKVLREAMPLDHAGGDFHDWLFLALAEHRLGHADAAKEAAAKARAAPRPDNAWDLAEVELLIAELDAAVPRTGK
jgi:serine/threonine protein kinase/WD40 repeat protein/Flp pilus assembly protein TadD